MGGNIFVSYRRDDSKHAAGRLVDRLQAQFDSDRLFLDVDNIELGLDFVEVITERVAACDVMLVIIGPHWLDAKGENGSRRLEDPGDFVRLEIKAALERNIRVIPLLVDGAAPVRAADLPEDLAPLANRQFTRLAHESFAADAERLTSALAHILEKPPLQSVEPCQPAAEEVDVRFDPSRSSTTAESQGSKSGIAFSGTFGRSATSTSEPREPIAPGSGSDTPVGKPAAEKPSERGRSGTWALLGVLTVLLGLLLASYLTALFLGFYLNMPILLLMVIVFLLVLAVPFRTPRYLPKSVVAGLVAFSVQTVLSMIA